MCLSIYDLKNEVCKSGNIMLFKKTNTAFFTKVAVILHHSLCKKKNGCQVLFSFKHI